MNIATLAPAHSDLAPCLDALLDARDSCQKRTDQVEVVSPAKMFSANYLLKLSASLELEEISTILKAEQIREEALLALRQGQIENGAAMLAQADAFCASRSLSPHACAAASTFQFAALAYLHHCNKDHAKAILALKKSIEDSLLLADKYGHDMEFRIVHLARNIIRTEALSRPFSEIVEKTANLIRYMGGAHDGWPYADIGVQSSPPSLSENELAWALDETVVNLAQKKSPVDERVLTFPAFEPPVCGGGSQEMLAAWAACEAIIAHRADDKALFIDRATRFYALQSGALEHSFKAVNALIDNR